ncbi:MAG TPA: HlyD family efflux transporter periplasmic adaptor subunit, partial [Quisquiliibacterium sp.]|nr:HlyD family efflux transporter periplasmic adaptor subunit [Quisquiliibacterium sp.]
AGRVQATVAGRLEPGPGGLPSVGQAVARGQLLVALRPTLDPIERSARAAQLAELQAAQALAQRRVARLRELADTVPRKEIEAAESELASLGARVAALSRGVAEVERLSAPIAGVIASANAVAGQVVAPRELLFEIVDPARLRIEATGFDPALSADIAGASIAVGATVVPLEFVGAGRVLREQAVPLVFRARHRALSGLAVGQPLPVTVRTRSSTEGVALPVEAVVRSSANEPIVWVKTQAERFEPRRVRTRPLDAGRLLVVDGLAGGERVVVEGTPLLNQVR